MQRRDARLLARASIALAVTVPLAACARIGDLGDLPGASGSGSGGSGSGGSGSVGSGPDIGTVADAGEGESEGTTAAPSGDGPSWDPNGAWTPVFEEPWDDDIDPAIWERGWFGEGITQPISVDLDAACFSSAAGHVDIVDDPGATDGKVLRLRLTQEANNVAGRDYAYTSGMVTTRDRFSFAYAAYEARILFPRTGADRIANYPAWWTDGIDWPTTGELKIGGALQAYWYGPLGLATIGGDMPGDGEWHTYGAERTETYVHIYYDGVPFGSLALGDNAPDPADAPHYLILHHGARSSGDDVVTAPADMLVDYVRVWER